MTTPPTLLPSHLLAFSSINFYYSLNIFRKLRDWSIGKFIYNHDFCIYIGKSNFFEVDLFSDQVMSYLNLFILLRKLKTSGKHNGSSVISFETNQNNSEIYILKLLKIKQSEKHSFQLL